MWIFIQKWHLSRHMKSAKHTELLKAKNEIKQQQGKEQKMKLKYVILVMLK